MSRFKASNLSRAVAVGLSLACAPAWGQSAGEQIIAALEHYRLAVLDHDIEAQVSCFTEDAQLSQGSEPVLQGRTTIRALLQSQRPFNLVTYDLRAAATRVSRNVAIQNGVYSQRFASAQGSPTLVKGVFEVQWSRQQDGSWLISRLQTDQVD
jgi:ketosteroid isomerase-like protein